ncbi:hypothetical protein GOV04_00755 [Candidatus Woesearchaeota archaeon]|nr:hypothetical protein [Candidatus Woesearchaeota archaeon]
MLEKKFEEFKRGYDQAKELLINIFESQEPKCDFRSAVHNTRAQGHQAAATIIEDFGRDIAWITYHLRHPIKTYNYRRSINE